MELENRHVDLTKEYSVSLTEANQEFNQSHSHIYTHLKRIMDLFIAIIGVVITSPFLVFFIIAIRLESKGPALYLQERVGLNGKYFNVLKLRSMRLNAEINGAQWATKDDPRITRIGSFIRKTRIDELPQLINVIKGDMSIVGPRPERPMFTAQFNEEIPGFIQRLSVRPGLTGWAQINGGYEITPKEKFELDCYYIRHFSFGIDLMIMLKTVKVVLTGNGAR